MREEYAEAISGRDTVESVPADTISEAGSGPAPSRA
jgi:hypothetical protein